MTRKTKLVTCAFAAIVVTLSGCAPGTSETAVPGTSSGPGASGAPVSAGPSIGPSLGPTGAGDPNVEVVQTSLLTFKSSIGGGGVQIIVTIKNSGGGIAEVGGANSETWTLYAKDGTVLQTGDLTPSQQFLKAGEVSYLAGWTNLSDNTTFSQVSKAEPSVTFAPAGTEPTQTLKVADVAVRSIDGVWMQASGTLSNTGTATVNLGTVILVLFDKSGKPIGWMQDSTAGLGLLAGQKKGFSTESWFVPASMASKIKTFKTYAYELAL